MNVYDVLQLMVMQQVSEKTVRHNHNIRLKAAVMVLKLMGLGN